MIIIFIGASVLPRISGDTGKTSIQSIREIPSNYLLRGSYTDSYWKFDEGSGSTAYDSSGHDYDGTIHGATWTSGKFSYALDFDGVDDYVDLDSHASKLGFNKTDDLVFSFYFISSSDKKGMIYSMSTGYGTNPEFHIFLAANGSIGMDVNVTSCGFSLHTKGGFNNNAWHHVELWYNGISNRPTVTIKIDDKVEAEVEEYVCSFTNDEYIKCKIGQRSHIQSENFDGKIDEFEITKYPGGNEQNPPDISGPDSGETGVEYEFCFTTNDPEEDQIQLYIEWGDGKIKDWGDEWYDSGKEVCFTHTYEDNGTFTIDARSRDVWHFSSKSHHVIAIGNLPPSAPTITGPKWGDPNVDLEYTFVATDEENDLVKYLIYWGDGDKEWTGFYPQSEAVTVTHKWNTEGIYEITSEAYDYEGNKGPLSAPYEVFIGNKRPNAPKITGPTNGQPRVEMCYNFSSTDSDGDNVYFDILWGDGSSDLNMGPVASGDKAEYCHTWEEEGTYKIEVKARDVWGKESLWTEFYITIQRSRAFNFNLLVWLFDRFPNAFPILRQLLGL